MAFIPLIAAAIPAIVSMIQSDQAKYNQPGASGVNGISLPDRSGYQNQLLQSGFNPQSDLYRIAGQQSMNNVNSDLANKGLGYSSAGNQAMYSAQNDLASKFLQNELQRRIESFNAATGYDMNANNARMGIAGAQNQDAWNRYTAGNLQNQQQIGNLSNLANIGVNGYMSNQYQNRADASNQQQQQNFAQLIAAINGSNGNGGYTQNPMGMRDVTNSVPQYGLGGSYKF